MSYIYSEQSNISGKLNGFEVNLSDNWIKEEIENATYIGRTFVWVGQTITAAIEYSSAETGSFFVVS